MDPLTALRQAIVKHKPVSSDGDNIIIDGVPYAGSAATAFRSGSGTNFYALKTIWTQYELRALGFAEYMPKALAAKAQLVVVSDKDALIAYLEGKADAPSNIDRAQLHAAQPVGRGAGASGGAAAEGSGLELALAKEFAFRTRTTVLEAESGRNLKEEVFKHFHLAHEKSAGGAPGAAGSSSRRQSVSSTGSSAEAAEAAAGNKRSRTGAPAGTIDPLAHFRGTPIILVPPASVATSLITIYNAKQLLEQGQFVHPEAAKAAWVGEKPSKVTIKRVDTRGHVCQYYVVDNPAQLQRHDWLKVVAVFAAGPDWQFKGWKWGRVPERDPSTGAMREPEDYPPVKIFNKALGFHLHYEGDPPHPNAARWNMRGLLPLSKIQRFKDASSMSAFWRAVDEDVLVRKPYLLPKGSGGASAAAGGGGGQ